MEYSLINMIPLHSRTIVQSSSFNSQPLQSSVLSPQAADVAWKMRRCPARRGRWDAGEKGEGWDMNINGSLTALAGSCPAGREAKKRFLGQADQERKSSTVYISTP